jgi:hypothetical protein
MTAKKLLKKTGKTVLYIALFLLVIVAGLLLFIHTDSGKNFIRNKTQSYLQKKLQTRVTIASVDFRLPKWIELKGIYLEDQKKDTLLFGEKVSIDINMLKLISGNIYIRKASFQNIYANIYRPANDSFFNYQFIVDAFGGNSNNQPIVEDTTALNITLQQLILDDIRLRFNDDFGGVYMAAAIDSLDVTLNKFQPDRMQFGLDDFLTTGVRIKIDITKENSIEKDSTASSTANLLLHSKQTDLRSVELRFNNTVNGMYYANTVNHFALQQLEFDMAKATLSVNKLLLDSSAINVVLPVADSTTGDSIAASPAWQVYVNEIKGRNNSFNLDNNQLPAAGGLDPAHLALKRIHLHAKNIAYTPDSSFAQVDQLSFTDKSSFTLDTTHAVIKYSNKGIEARELYIKTPQSLIQHSLSFTYDDLATITTFPGNTRLDVVLKNSVIAVNDLYLLAPFVKKYLPEEKFRNNSIQLSTKIQGTLQRLEIPSLHLSGLSGSILQATAILYNVTDSNRLAYDITVFNSRLLKEDLVKFVPASNEAISKLPPVINFGTRLKGTLKASTATIDVNSNGFSIAANGSIRNIQAPEKLQYDIAIRKSSISKSFIEAMVPPGTIPPNIGLPAVIAVTGTARGDMNNIQTNTALSGSYGNAAVKGYIRNFKNPEAAVYDLQLSTSSFELGRLLKKDTLIGKLSFSGTAKGKGFNYKTMNAVIDGAVSSAAIKNYEYKNIQVNANLQQGIIESTGSVNDSNLVMNYTANVNVQGAYPSIEARINIDTVQLKELNLFADTLNAAFVAYINAPNLDPANIDLYAAIDSIKMNIQNRLYAPDSIRLTSKTIAGVNTTSLLSPVADVAAAGRFQFDKIGPSILQYVDRYYNITDTVMGSIAPQEISFYGVIKESDLVKGMLPGLDYDSIHFAGSYASAQNDSALQIKASLPMLSYQTTRVSNGKIDIATLNQQLTGSLLFDTLSAGGNTFYKTAVTAGVYADSISVSAVTKDQKDIDRFALGANITQRDKAYTFSMKDSLLLNYKKWSVNSNNKVTYSPDGILVKDFILGNDSTRLAATSRENILNSPIDISIDNFKIKDITSMLNSDTLLAEGIIDGKFSVSEFEKKLPAFTGDLRIDSLQFMQQPVGNIRLFAERQGENSIASTLTLTGNGNDVSMKGTYYLNNNDKQFDAAIRIADLKMTTLQAFSQGNLSRSSGSIRGNIALDGKFTEPHWNGQVVFDSTRFSLVKLGTAYTINKQAIDLKYPVISIDNFSILDSASNKMVIDGYIASSSLTEYDLNLDVNARNFTLVNVSKAIANQVYGFAAIDADISVTGSSVSPGIEGNLSLTDKTDVTLVMPESNVNKDAAKSVVRFIDRDTFDLPERASLTPEQEVKPSFAQYLNYNLNVEVSKKAALTIIIDPSSGDELKIQGDAQLNAGVDPGGNIILAGNYELNSGYYILNYQFLRKQFNLLPGSTLQFSGDPREAQINITAEYIANTSAKDLIGNEVGEVDPRLAVTFRQEIPFRVLLMMKGPMKKPEISFDIQLPDENTAINSELRTTIENKLTQLRGDVAGTNKQVFSLLLLNRFVGEQSTDFFKGSGGDGGGFNNLARESVSKFLSSALDNIASDLFKGLDVDLNLDTYRDYSTGDEQQKTDLNIAVTKSFVNDRLSITVGRSFGIEGQDANARASKQQGTPFLPDVTLNYKLTQDGKYLVRAYKKTQFEVILDGYVIETGLAFIVTLNYDKFRELFVKKQKSTPVTK